MLSRIGLENYARLERDFKVTAIHENYCMLNSILLLATVSQLEVDSEGEMNPISLKANLFEMHIVLCLDGQSTTYKLTSPLDYGLLDIKIRERLWSGHLLSHILTVFLDTFLSCGINSFESFQACSKLFTFFL